MNRILLAAAVTSPLLTAVPAYADDREQDSGMFIYGGVGSQDSHSLGYVGAGYKFNKYVAVYTREQQEDQGSFEGSSSAVGVRGYIPINNNFRIYGDLGWNMGDLEQPILGAEVLPNAAEYAVGIQADVSESAFFDAGFRRQRWGADKDYSFESMNVIQVGVGFSF